MWYLSAQNEMVGSENYQYFIFAEENANAYNANNMHL